MGVELSRQDCLHTASNPTGISLILYRECCIKYLKQSVYIDIIYIQILYTIPVFVRFKEVVLHIFHYKKLSCIFTRRFFSAEELTAGFYEALASCGALPRRWHLDGRHGAVRCDPKMKDMRLLQLTPEAALVFQEFMIGKLRKSSRYLTANVMEYLQQDRDQSWKMHMICDHFWVFFYRFNVFSNQESHFQHSRRLLERPNLSSSCKVADEHPLVAGEREVDHLFETTIKSRKGLWEVEWLAAAQNRSALAAIPYI